MHIDIDLIYDKRSYFGVSDTNLEIHGEKHDRVFYDKVLHEIT
jgi:hypothetical protein